MKKFHCYFLTIGISLSAMSGFAQNVGINEDGSLPNPNAILDVKSFTKGILIPRVSSSGRLAIPNVKGMLVYDSTVNSFWYNNGSGWQNLASAAGWLLGGNSGTDSSNFIGTTDNKPLFIKVNNQPAGRIDAASPNNTAWGYRSGGNSTSGEPNTAIGAFSMLSNGSGGYNTAVGTSSLQTNVSGAFNTAIGHGSMNFSVGSNNTAVGAFTLQRNTTGFYNMAFGGGALENCTTGLGNVGIGFESLFVDSTGSQNTAIGLFTLQQNSTGGFNTVVGSSSLANNTTGGSNTAIGANTLSRNTTGVSNTALGGSTMNTNTTGVQNTVIGSGADVSVGTLTNATAIGANAVVNASNKVRIGNSNVTVIEGQVPFTTPSDGRFKFEVQEDVKGLDFILQLRPVTYRFDVKKFDDQNRQGTAAASDVIQASYKEATAIRRTGFIAQEVEKAANVSGYNFSGIIKPRTEQDHYSLSYESFVVPLVKGMQEQQKIIANLQRQIDELKKEIRRSK